MKYCLRFVTILRRLERKYTQKVFFRQYCEKSNNLQLKDLNPFRSRQRNFLDYGDTGPIANRICITIFGNGAHGQPRCLALFTNTKAFLFNCGEGVGRLCKEYEVLAYNIKNIFITYKSWSNVSGIPDIFLSNNMYGVHKMNIHGPPGVELFTSVVSSYPSQISLKRKTENHGDDNIQIRSIPIVRTFDFSDRNIKKCIYENSDGSNVVHCYSCTIFGNVGEFLPEKCVELGIPIGPHLLKLKNGEDVILPSGRKICHEEVTDDSTPTCTFLVVDCPSEEFLDLFVCNKKLCHYQLPTDNAKNVPVVFHFSPSHIVKMQKYQDWMRKFHQDTEHYLLNTDNSPVCSEAVYHTQNILHLLHPNIFKLLPDKQKPHFPCNINNVKVVQPPPMLQMYFRPKRKLDWCNVVNTNIEPNADNLIFDIPQFQELKNSQSTSSQNAKQSVTFPEVVFLGTSSSTSSPFRNVSAILLNIDASKSMLLDCGEGTLSQLVRYYGSSDIYKTLRKLSCIFITHKHTDHYMGLFEIIQSRKEAFENLYLPYEPLFLILPYKIKEILHKFSDIFSNINPDVKILSCKSFVRDNPKRAFQLSLLKNILGGAEIETVPVIHCNDAYGAVIQIGSKWKIVYSGDTAPCQKLIDAGHGCTLLIHESSIEDNLENEAVIKNHCTPAQVVDIAQKMNAKYTIMTHFSKRYLAIPVIQNYDCNNVGFAFDFMKVNLKDLHSLSKILPSMQAIFQEQLDLHLEKTSAAASFENVFLKTYRSIRSN